MKQPDPAPSTGTRAPVRSRQQRAERAQRVRRQRRQNGLGILLAGVAVALVFHGTGSWWHAGGVWLAFAVLLAVERRSRPADTPGVAAGVDATTLQAAIREAQRESEARVMSLELGFDRASSVLEALGDAVIVVDAAAEIVLANPAARAVLRTDGEAPEGRSLWEALAPELVAAAARALDSAAPDAHRTSGSVVTRAAAATHSGPVRCDDSIYDISAFPVQSELSGQGFGTVLLIVDSTRAHEAQRLKDRFLSSMSHELRTPLTNICAYAEILRTMMPGDSMDWPEFVRVIHEEGLRLSRLVDAVFDFLQLDSGEAVFRHDALDVAALVRQVAAEQTARADAASLRIELALAADLPRPVGDAARFQQLFRNLLDNALKFTPSGGLIRISAGAVDDAVVVQVDDSGPGVPEAERELVFGKFHQLSDHMTAQTHGTGLGLATCRAIAGRLGGQICCERSDLGGARFVVRLPVPSPRVRTAPPAEAVEAGGGQAATAGLAALFANAPPARATGRSGNMEEAAQSIAAAVDLPSPEPAAAAASADDALARLFDGR